MEWFLPISCNDLIKGRPCLWLWCWCLCLLSRASLTFSRFANSNLRTRKLDFWDISGKLNQTNRLLLTILSIARSAICSMDVASMSRITEPLRSKLLNSNKECRESVATWGFDHLFPPWKKNYFDAYIGLLTNLLPHLLQIWSIWLFPSIPYRHHRRRVLPFQRIRGGTRVFRHLDLRPKWIGPFGMVEYLKKN